MEVSEMQLSMWSVARKLGHDLMAVWVLAIAGTGIGIVLNQLRNNPLPLTYSPKAERIEKIAANISREDQPGLTAKRTEERAILPAPAVDVRAMELSDILDIVELRSSGIVLDARPEIFHRLGHIPGSIGLSREEFARDYYKRRSLLERDKSQPIAVYCSGGDCEDSRLVAKALTQLNYTRVFIFKGGWDQWTANHLPEEKSE